MDGSVNKRSVGNAARGICSVSVIALFTAAILLGTGRISGYFNEGLRLATERVLPTAFPFMVLSSLALAMIDTEAMPRLSRGFERIFSVGGAGFPALVVGSLAGFPIGAKMTADIYRGGDLTKDEAERLIAYSSAASPPFVLAAVGAGMLGDIALGAVLLTSVYLSTALSAQLFRSKRDFLNKSVENIRQKYDFVESVKSAATSSIYMTAFVTLFYILSKCLTDAVKFAPIGTALTLFLEVTGALATVSDSALLPIPKLGLCGFALGFGGLSVMAQTAAVIKGSGLTMRRYLPIKLAEGALCALIAMGLGAWYTYL